MRVCRHILIVLIFFSLAGNLFAGEVELMEKTQLINLMGKKIYFGHQSVGFNILDGIRDLESDQPDLNLNIVELQNDFYLKSSGFYHSRIGSNVHPVSKIDDFSDKLTAGIGETADIAFFKFCFVDINSSTDVKYIFDHYVKVMAGLKAKYPQVGIVHFTVPLEKNQINWKTRIKILIGKDQIWEFEGNVKKNQFNDMLKKHYGGKEPIFDIAQYESTLPDKTRSSFVQADQTYFELAEEYTYDDGHLNEKGRIHIAEMLLKFIVQM